MNCVLAMTFVMLQEDLPFILSSWKVNLLIKK